LSEFAPIRQPRVSEVVFERIKESILVGRFKPGDKLPAERDLAVQFQVSRVAVREALRALENSGFVTTRQGVAGGAFVTQLTFERLSGAFLDLFMAGRMSTPELHQIRLILEPRAAALAAERITPARREMLIKAQKDEDIDHSSHREMVIRGTRVHYLIAEFSDNRVMQAIIGSLIDLNCEIVAKVKPDRDKVHPSGVHAPIIETVCAGDPAAATEAMHEHLKDFGHKLLKMENLYRERTGIKH